MTIAQRLLVKNNIDSLGTHINKLSQIFYRELFHIEIGLKEIFPGNVVFLNRKFANMLGTFKNVEHLEKISASVEKMGERHSQNYAVHLEHFEPIEQALLLALHEYFADEFTVELEAAWHNVFQEVADIMKQAMACVAHQPKTERLHDILSYDTRLLHAVQGIEGVRKVHQRFYDEMFNEPWLGQFFYGKAKDVLVDKQTQFMVAAFGGENLYKGDTPAFVHMHMYVTDEMSDLRQQILRRAILAEGYSNSIADRWLKVDDSFRASIVKNSVDECVLKCVGQMPVVAKKPENYHH